MALKTRYSPLQHFSVANLFGALGELSPRNKAMALGLAGLAVLLILLLPFSLVSGKIRSLKKEIASAQKGYAQVVEKIAAYEKIRTETAALEQKFSRPPGSLTSRVDAVARQAGLNVDQLKEKAPQETDYLEIDSIEVKLSGVGLQQLMEFLYHLENDRTSPMRVRRIQIKPKSANRQLLDVNLEVATFILKKEV
jgi:type II secretory pathway component PulM